MAINISPDNLLALCNEWKSLSDADRAHAWSHMSEAHKNLVRDLSGLTTDLIGLEGQRIEVTYPDGSKERFYVGRSNGWRPCHIAIKTRRSSGGSQVYWPEGTCFVRVFRK